MDDQANSVASFLALDLPTAARITCTNRRRLERAIAEHKLTARKNGRVTLVLPHELQRWLQSLPAIGRQPGEVVS